MQDEHENEGGEIGMLRPDASTYAECRESEPGADPGVSSVQPGHRVCREAAKRGVRLGGRGSGGPRVCGTKQKRTGLDPWLYREDNRPERVANDAAGEGVSGQRKGGNEAVPAAQVRQAVQRRRPGVAGRSGSGTRMVEWSGHALHSETGVRTVQQAGICATVADLSRASVQPAPEPALPQAGGGVREDSTESGVDRRTEEAGSARTAGLSPGRYGTSRRLGGSQRRVSHQCRRHGDAMASSGLHEQDQRTVCAAGIRSDAASVSIPDSGVPCRQRVGIHQSPGGGDAEETAGGIHQEPGVPEPRQRTGGRKKRSGNPQTHGIRAHCRRACRGTAEVLHGASEPVFELSSAVRLCDGQPGRARKAEEEVQNGRLPHAVREAEVLSGGQQIFEERHELRADGPDGSGEQRHRMRAPDGGGEEKAIAAVQDGIAAPAALRLTPGGELWKWRSGGKPGKPKSGFPPFPRLLGNLAKAARFPHSHSSGGLYQGRRKRGTGRSVGYGKVEIQRRDSHFPTAPTAGGARKKIVQTKA